MNVYGEMEIADDIENFSDAGFENIEDEYEQEPYLILIVHGIGSNSETQKLNKYHFDSCVKSLLKTGLIDASFEIVVRPIKFYSKYSNDSYSVLHLT